MIRAMWSWAWPRLLIYVGGAVAAMASLLVIGFLFAPARAADCAPLDHVLKEISKAVPITKTVRLDPAQTANVIIWWNEQEPQSNDAYNMAVVIAHPNGRLGLLVGNDGNICASLGLKPDMMESFFEAIAGRPPKAGSI